MCLVLLEAGKPRGRRGFRSFPDYSCTFRDTGGATVFVDENDELIDKTVTYHAFRAVGWASWVLGVAIGVGLSAALGLLKRD